ncbi:MAG: hypothetical protein LH614_16850 [Pyrinomonadaceae bacterium]|nr:hypothetical protein [Pyrinomonadaceae bacterium]
MNWTVENVPELRGYAVEWAEPNNFYLSRRNRLFHATSLKPPFKSITVVDAPFIKQIAANFRLAQRVLRFMVTNVVPLANGDLFVTFDKSVGILRDGKYQTLEGLERPCRVLRAACAIDDHGDIYFGEYLPNTERGAMRIYRYKPGANAVEVAHTFPPHTIRHIHGLYFDKFSDSVFCLTGDDDKECCFWRSSDGFQTTEIVGEGDETWRAVSVLFSENAFYYGMDAEYRTNHIYKVERATMNRKSLGEVSGTVFYSKRLGKDLFFATTAENAPSQIENVAALWHVDENDQLENLIQFPKDRWHPTLFMFGTIHFPYHNNLENELYFQLVGVKGDNQTFRVKRTA